MSVECMRIKPIQQIPTPPRMREQLQHAGGKYTILPNWTFVEIQKEISTADFFIYLLKL